MENTQETPENLPDGIDLVKLVIRSLDGGFNGENPNQQLGITENEDGDIDYTLTDQETGIVQHFIVTVTQKELETE